MDYRSALKRPWTGLRSILIGTAFGMIPLANLFVTGYLAEAARTAMHRHFELPPWKRWKSLFADGLVVAIVILAYQLPALAFAAFTADKPMAALSDAAMRFFFAGGMTSAPGSMDYYYFGTYFVYLLMLQAVLFYFSAAAIMKFAAEKSMKSAFAFTDVFRKALTARFFTAFIMSVIISVVYSLALMYLLGLMGLPGRLVAGGMLMYVTGITAFSLLGQAYSEE